MIGDVSNKACPNLHYVFLCCLSHHKRLFFGNFASFHCQQIYFYQIMFCNFIEIIHIYLVLTIIYGFSKKIKNIRCPSLSKIFISLLCFYYLVRNYIMILLICISLTRINIFYGAHFHGKVNILRGVVLSHVVPNSPRDPYMEPSTHIN